MNQELGKRIPLEGTINTRDLGGYETIDHHHIRYQRLIRTDALYKITKKDEAYLHDVLHARYDVDFRGKKEASELPDKEIEGCKYLFLPIQEDLNESLPLHPHQPFIIDKPDVKETVEYLFRVSPDGDITKAFEKNYKTFLAPYGQKQYSRFLHLCKDNKEGSILFHCADGKDRAGTGATLLLEALGVDRETIFADYLKTNEYTKGKAEARVKYLREECGIRDAKVLASIGYIAGVRRNWLEAIFSILDSYPGGSRQYFKEKLAFKEEDIKELRENYLE